MVDFCHKIIEAIMAALVFYAFVPGVFTLSAWSIGAPIVFAQEFEPQTATVLSLLHVIATITGLGIGIASEQHP